MVHVRYASLLLFWTLQCVTGHFCNLYDVTSTPLTSLAALTKSECGFNCGMTSGCMNFGLCHDSTADNCSYYKSVSKTNCGTSSSVVCILFIKEFCSAFPCPTTAHVSTDVAETTSAGESTSTTTTAALTTTTAVLTTTPVPTTTAAIDPATMSTQTQSMTSTTPITTTTPTSTTTEALATTATSTTTEATTTSTTTEATTTTASTTTQATVTTTTLDPICAAFPELCQ